MCTKKIISLFLNQNICCGYSNEPSQLFPSSQQYIYASLDKIHQTVQKIRCTETLFWTFQSAHVTLKIRSRSPKSSKLFSFSQKCIYASLVKIHKLVQKITHKEEEDTNGIRTKNMKGTYRQGSCYMLPPHLPPSHENGRNILFPLIFP